MAGNAKKGEETDYLLGDVAAGGNVNTTDADLEAGLPEKKVLGTSREGCQIIYLIVLTLLTLQMWLTGIAMILLSVYSLRRVGQIFAYAPTVIGGAVLIIWLCYVCILGCVRGCCRPA